MPHREMCKVVKGRFPESAADVDEAFSLVSIDTDLYLPTYFGLEFFFDKLSKNGYILVHDFNHKYYSGVREAVIRFCKEKEIGYCPVADSAGTVIITK
jgi:O-methyltransferase